MTIKVNKLALYVYNLLYVNFNFNWNNKIVEEMYLSDVIKIIIILTVMLLKHQ